MSELESEEKTPYQLVKEARQKAEEEKRCDPDDIICQAERLDKMKNMRETFDDEEFKEKYPSLVELKDRLDESIKAEEEDLKRRREICNLPADIEKGIEEEFHEP